MNEPIATGCATVDELLGGGFERGAVTQLYGPPASGKTNLALAAAVEVADAAEPLIRIGDGARLRGAKIIDDIENVHVELVDETGTTPYLGSGARGMGDVLAAVNIARLEGDRIEDRDVEPTGGEIQRIQDRSRERSEDGRAIDEALARRVAVGELTMTQALEEHLPDD